METKLRRVEMADAEILLEWRNDAQTRQNSFSKDIITLDTHVKWLERKLSDPCCHMFMLLADGEPAGNIRIDVTDNIGEVSYTIAPYMRGKGLGTAVLHLLEENVPADIKALVGFVNVHNEASARCFEKNGYTRLAAGEIVSFIKLLEDK